MTPFYKQYKKPFVSFACSILALGTTAYAQDDRGISSSQVDIVKEYDPDIIDALKQKTPPVVSTTSKQNQKELNYSIIEVPVVSSFKPTKSRAIELSKTKKKHYFEDHLSLGYGNYNNIMVDGYINHDLDRYSRIEGILHHRSSQGGIKDVVDTNSFYDSDLEVTYHNQHRSHEYHIGGIVRHNLLHWYGVGDRNLYTDVNDDALKKADFKQQYVNYGLKGGMEMYDGFFRGFEAD